MTGLDIDPVGCWLAFSVCAFHIVGQMVTNENLLGPHEQVVLLAILRIGEGAYGMTIRREVEQRAGCKLSIGSVYTTLERLQRKGYVRSRQGEPTAERGGRAKRHYRITVNGERGRCAVGRWYHNSRKQSRRRRLVKSSAGLLLASDHAKTP
jgi:PadR family transcriptional regulator, regulatory protein PadR